MVGVLPSLARLQGRGKRRRETALIKARVPGAPITGNELQLITIGAMTRRRSERGTKLAGARAEEDPRPAIRAGLAEDSTLVVRERVRVRERPCCPQHQVYVFFLVRAQLNTCPTHHDLTVDDRAFLRTLQQSGFDQSQ
jgi:hypothetical protein